MSTKFCHRTPLDRVCALGQVARKRPPLFWITTSSFSLAEVAPMKRMTPIGEGSFSFSTGAGLRREPTKSGSAERKSVDAFACGWLGSHRRTTHSCTSKAPSGVLGAVAGWAREERATTDEHR